MALQKMYRGNLGSLSMVKSEGLLLSYFQSEIVFSSHKACLHYSSFHNLHSRFQPNIPSTLKIVDEPQQQLIKLNLLVFFIAL